MAEFNGCELPEDLYYDLDYLWAQPKDDGTFTLSAPTRDVTISIRSIGFKRTDIPVPASQNAVSAALARDYFQLEAIVVTGQATGVERKNLANAVATVNAQQLAQGRVRAAHMPVTIAWS